MSHQEAVPLPGPDQVRFRAPALQRPPMLVAGGAVLLLLAWLLGRADPVRWLTGYLVAFVFVLTLALGGLFFALMIHTSRAAWGVVLRRIAEAAGATLPVFIVLFLPIALGAGHLYPWIGAGHGHGGAHAELLAHKSPYLNLPFFFVRAAICLAVWAVLGWWFWRRSTAQDARPDPAGAARLRAVSHVGLVLFALTITVASFDWVMSLTPTWYSTMFGVYFFSGIAVAALAFPVIVALLLERRGAFHGLTDEHLHDLGKLLFAFVVFWAYIAFSQFLLIWYANLPEETAWYELRLTGGWTTATVVLALGHFVLPFFFMLSRGVKRRRVTLLVSAAWMLLLHLFDVVWLVVPSVPAAGDGWWLPALLCTIGIGALVRGAFFAVLERAATVPTGDPRLAESLVIESG